MKQDKIVRKAKKLLELARRGEGGERDNAERMLTKFLNKYGLVLRDLESDSVSKYPFHHKNKFQYKILFQVIHKVVNLDEVTYWERGNTVKLFELTPSQYAEAAYLYETYCAAWEIELDDTIKAFIHANEIYSDRPSKSTADDDIDLAELERIFNKARSMERVQVNKLLGDS